MAMTCMRLVWQGPVSACRAGARDRRSQFSISASGFPLMVAEKATLGAAAGHGAPGGQPEDEEQPAAASATARLVRRAGITAPV